MEAKIVRDADILDALGAVGIARAFMFGGFLGEPIWTQASIQARFVPGKSHSVVAHFFEKLLNLDAEMCTDMGKRLARERCAYMRAFIRQLVVDLCLDEMTLAEIGARLCAYEQ
ncbi:MAG: HD domain-containing protein [Janthinobacterium lividum]